MYKISLEFRRKAAERKDPFLSWKRSDQTFFAVGAFYILAQLFLELHAVEPYTLIHIKPLAGYSGNHFYVTYGT